MYRRYNVNLFGKTPKKRLCPLCRVDINTAKKTSADTALRFIGPVMVRSEKDYHILALPSFIKIYFGSLDSIVPRDLIAEARQIIASHAAKPDSVAVVIDIDGLPDAKKDPRKLLQAVNKAMKDPYSTVRLGVNTIRQRIPHPPPAFPFQSPARK